MNFHLVDMTYNFDHYTFNGGLSTNQVGSIWIRIYYVLRNSHINSFNTILKTCKKQSIENVIKFKEVS